MNNILLLIDGNALVHRSFHGMPELKTRDGILVNAVYGFTTSVLAAIQKFNPKYLAVAFDVSKTTFRNKLFTLYKANRKKTDENLIKQMPLVYEVCKAMNFPIFGLKDYEADDIIGTICKKIKNTKIIIVTGDMDSLQLVDKNTEVFSLARGLKKAILYNEKEVYKKYGFSPNELTDYKALRGDPSDNIPGVAKIGEITAKKLVTKYKTLENIYKNINLIKEKTKKLLLDGKDSAYLSKKLATINQKVPIDFKLSQAKISNYDKQKAIKLFTKLEFKSIIQKLPQEIKNHSQQKLF